MARLGLFLQIPPNVENTPQILELEALLEDDRALLYAFRLWAWSFTNKSRICSLSPLALARACRWSGDPLLLRQSLCSAGLMREDDGYVRGFDGRYQKVFEQHEQERQRKAGERAASKAIKEQVAKPRKRSAAAERQARYKAKKQAEAATQGASPSASAPPVSVTSASAPSVTQASAVTPPGDASGVSADALLTSPGVSADGGADAQIAQQMQNTRHQAVRTEPVRKTQTQIKKEDQDQSSTGQVDRNIPTPQRVAEETMDAEHSRAAVDDDDSPMAFVMRAKAACDRRNADPEFIAAMKDRESSLSDEEEKSDTGPTREPERPSQGSTARSGSLRNMPSHVRNDQWARMQASEQFQLPRDRRQPMTTADAQDWAEANAVSSKVTEDLRKEFDAAKVTWQEFLSARQSAADRRYSYDHVGYLLRAAMKDRKAPKGKPTEAHAGYMTMVREVADEHGLAPGGPLTANALLQKGYETRAQLQAAAQYCAQSMTELMDRKPSTPSPQREPTKSMISASEIVAKVMPQG